MTLAGSRRLLGYPGRYVEALRQRRRIRRLPEELPFEESFAVARQIGVTQKPDEIRALFGRVRTEQPKRVLEIGLDRGGTLFLWTRAAAPDAHLISIDTCPLGPLGPLSPFALECRGFARSGQRIDLLMPADSHRAETLLSVESRFRGEPVDFLFLDGDHTYDGVRRDFELYAKLVRAGGLIAFHDIAPLTTPETEGTARFWRELAAERPVEEFVAPGEPGFGIGLIRIPS